MNAVEVVLFIEDEKRMAEGEILARRMHLPIVSDEHSHQLVLTLTQERLELRFPFEKINPVFVDFLTKSTEQRLQTSRGRKELIARAVGVKGSYLPSIVDATAGLGRDALVLASLGCEVKMVERSSIICSLLEDAIKRAKKQEPEWLPNLTLFCDDAKIFLQTALNAQESVDVVYLDPMFPQRVKSALVKKEMRILKNIVGSDEDAGELFAIARKVAKKRVVVKRPKLAPTLTDEKPSIVYNGKVCRFDVYL